MRPIPRYETKTNPSTVWRDALGPGYAVGVAEGLLRGRRFSGRPTLQGSPLTSLPASTGPAQRSPIGG